MKEARINRQFMKKVLDDSQSRLSKLFDDLLHIKNFKRPDFDFKKIIYFQYNLGKTLFNLTQARNRIAAEEKKMIGKKTKLSGKWFATQMKKLAIYKSSLERPIHICKALGDAFAWHFYKGNETKLFKHLDHEEIKFPSTGTGGLGELAFIREYPVINGYLCILHSNTSLLRFGDISLIKMQTMDLVAIGELKADRKSENTISLSLTLITEDGKDISDLGPFKNIVITENVSEKSFKSQQHERQLKAISKYINSEKDKKSENDHLIYDNYYIKEFESLVTDTKKEMSYLKVSNGLGFISIPVRPTRFSTLLFSADPNKRPQIDNNMLNALTMSLQSPEPINFPMQHGKILYDEYFRYTAPIGSAPLFWYPIKKDILRKIYFQEIFVMTLFNPGFLFRDLRAIGLDFIRSKTDSKLFFGAHIGDKQMGIERMNYYLRLITSHLQVESAIVKALTVVIEMTRKYAESGRPFMAELVTLQIFDSYNIDIDDNVELKK